jgi:hypothetical protein
MFSEQIGWIHFSGDLAEVDASQTDGLLNPQRMCIQVAELAEALPVADAYGRAGVGPYAQVGTYAEVAEKRLIT